MTIEELEAAQRRSHELLNLNSGVDVEIFDDVRKYAYNQVAAILDSVNDFFVDRELTEEQAKSIEAASSRPPAKVKTGALPYAVDGESR